MIEGTTTLWFHKWTWTFDYEQSCLLNCKATQESEEREEIYCVAVFGSKLQLKKEVNWPGVSEKLMFFLQLETSTNKSTSEQVQVQTSTSELRWMNFCVFFLSQHPSNKYFFLESFSLVSSLFFSEICPENSSEIPAKSAVLFTNLSLQIPRNLTFFLQIIRSPA